MQGSPNPEYLLMSLDLSTLLVMRFSVDLLIAIAFGAMVRRYPSIGGPGWWALGSLINLFGAMGMVMPLGGQHAMVLALSSTLVFLSSLSVWLGLRAYLGLALPWTRCAVATALVAGLNGLGAVRFGQPEFSQGMLAASCMLVVAWALWDIRASQKARRQPEFAALTVLMGIEWLILAALLSWVLWPSLRPAGLMVPWFLAAFLMAKMVRAVLYSALVSLRLRREAEAARRAVESREAESRALVDNLGAGVLVLRADGEVLGINAAARRGLGLDTGGGPPDAMHVRDWILLREDGSPMPLPEQPIARVLAQGRAVDNVVMGIQPRPDSKELWVLCNAYPENDRLGALRHVVFTFVDITLLRRAQQQQKLLAEQLAQSRKMDALGTLAGGIAHDFNNILAAILGNADLARQDVMSGAAARESLDEISNAARRGRELVRQIMAFSRQQPMERALVHLHDIVQETSALLRTALTPQIQLAVTSCEGSAVLRADPTQIGQVLLNLGTNAIHAMQGQPGRLELRVTEVPADDPQLPEELARTCRQEGVGAVSVAVSDTGCGMDDATRRRIFDPFFTTKPVGQGTGLGLPVVLGIVQSHGGAIRVDSEPGKGSTFTLYFPMEAAGATAVEAGTIAPGPVHRAALPPIAHEESQPMSTPPAGATGHVLYLDDDDTLVFLVRRLLVRRGYEVTTFCDQQEAIDAVRASPDRYDLLLTDYNMPGMSGIDVARAVLAINPALTVAVASGYINDELEQAAQAAGVREVVFKTDAIESFCEVVQRLVTRPAGC